MRRTNGRWWLPAAVDTCLVVLALTVDLVLWGDDAPLRDGRDLPVWVVPTAAVMCYAVLLKRRRNPQLAFVVMWAFALVGVVLPSYSPLAGLLVALYTVSVRLPLRPALLALIACFVPFSVNCWNGASTREHLTTSFAVSFSGQMFFYALVCGAVWGAGRIVYAAEQRSVLAQERHAIEATAAVEAERLRLARDLHDIVTHAVSAMLLQAAGARTLVRPEDERVRAALGFIEASGVQAMHELHRLLGLLRSGESAPGQEGDSYDRQPTLADISCLIELARSGEVEVVVTTTGTVGRLDPSVDLAAYRILQETLTNTMKHGGRGPVAHVQLDWKTDELDITVRSTSGLPGVEADRMPGMSSGHGLLGLTERVTLVGGSLDAGPLAGGYLVRAALPARIDPTAVALPAAAGTTLVP